MRFRDLKPVKLADVPYGRYFWAMDVTPAKKMTDLFRALRCWAHDNCIVHRDKKTGEVYHYNAFDSLIVYVPKREVDPAPTKQPIDL